MHGLGSRLKTRGSKLENAESIDRDALEMTAAPAVVVVGRTGTQTIAVATVVAIRTAAGSKVNVRVTWRFMDSYKWGYK